MNEPSLSPSLLHETRPNLSGLTIEPANLPAVPGGWTERPIEVGATTFQLTLPANPDAFLDDPAVAAAHERDSYMPYWAYLWPASVRMALLLKLAPWAAGTQVLELGTGVGLVGLAALQQGWQVTMTDYDPVAVELALHNARRNRLENRAAAFTLDWRSPRSEQFPIIIGCELTYEQANHLPLLQVLRKMLSPEGTCWLGDAGRTQSEFFPTAARKAGFNCRLLDERIEPIAVPRFGQFQLFELRHSSHPASNNETLENTILSSC